MKESTLRRRVGEEVRKLGGSCIPIETSTASGVPDCIIAHPLCRPFWLELKIWHGGRVEISPMQVAWAYKHSPSFNIFLGAYNPASKRFNIWQAPYSFDPKSNRLAVTPTSEATGCLTIKESIESIISFLQ